jgi:ABC-2 type transport system permease protein
VGFFGKLRGLLVVYYAYMNEYRAELLLWALANSLSFILMGVWYEATERGAFAFAPIDVVRYFLAVFVMRQLTVVWVIWEFEQDVLRGRMSHFLLQPIDPVWRYVSAHLSERLARLPFSFGLVVLFFLLYPPAFFIPRPLDALLSIVFVVIAFALRFALQYTFALLAFWTERAGSVESLVFIVYMFLSGAVAPLDVFPPLVKEAVLYTPFPYLIWVPARLLVGGADIDVVRAFLVCAIWFVALVIINRLLWRRALKRHSAMGA